MHQEATVRIEHGPTDWFQIGKGICKGCILLPCKFNLYAKNITQNAGLDEAQAGIMVAGIQTHHFMANRRGNNGNLETLFLGALPAILWNSAFKWVYLSFSPLPLASLVFPGICKGSSDNHFAFLYFFFLDMVLIPASCTMS